MKIFELRDTTNDEMYFSLGLFTSLEDAFASINEGNQEPGYAPPCSEEDPGDHIRLEIYSRPIGLGDAVWEWTGEYEHVYNEETDSYCWVQAKVSSKAIAVQPG